MSLRPDERTEHGGPRWWVTVLGAVAVVVALVLIGSSVSGFRARDRVSTPDAARVAAPPYLIEPAVRIQAIEATEPPSPERASAAGRPVRLVVPRLSVDAPVYPIGAPGGVLTPPSNPQTLGWWDGGAVPGARHGGALITGHTVHTGGGAFDDLETLRAGDSVRVRTDKGVIRYAVTGVTIYRKASLARDAAKVFRQDGPGRLVLITCEDWNGSIYLSNAVVFADPLSPGPASASR